MVLETPILYTVLTMDNKTEEQRIHNMVAVTVINTKPELLVRQALFRQGFKYRLNHKKLPGSTDIILKRYKTFIFVNVCFWDCHFWCKKAVLALTNAVFWRKKTEDTKTHDKRKIKQLSSLGWYYLTCEECNISHNRYAFFNNDGYLDFIVQKEIFL